MWVGYNHLPQLFHGQSPTPGLAPAGAAAVHRRVLSRPHAAVPTGGAPFSGGAAGDCGRASEGRCRHCSGAGAQAAAVQSARGGAHPNAQAGLTARIADRAGLPARRPHTGPCPRRLAVRADSRQFALKKAKNSINASRFAHFDDGGKAYMPHSGGSAVDNRSRSSGR